MSCWLIFLFIWIFFMPITYAIPLYLLEKNYLHNDVNIKAEAIVILGGGVTDSTSYPRPNLAPLLLERVRLGAYLQRKTSLPILLTGGGSHAKATEAEVMKRVLEEEFYAKVDFMEERSKSTIENAKFSSEILEEKHIKSIFLVTNSWHLRRATYLFEKYTKGVKVVSISDFFYVNKKFETNYRDFIPSMATPYYQRRVWSELLGLSWVKWKMRSECS